MDCQYRGQGIRWGRRKDREEDSDRINRIYRKDKTRSREAIARKGGSLPLAPASYRVCKPAPCKRPTLPPLRGHGRFTEGRRRSVSGYDRLRIPRNAPGIKIGFNQTRCYGKKEKLDLLYSLLNFDSSKLSFVFSNIKLTVYRRDKYFYGLLREAASLPRKAASSLFAYCNN